jgi:hypothetical protein
MIKNKKIALITSITIIISMILISTNVSGATSQEIPRYTITISSVGSIYTINALPVSFIPKNVSYYGILEIMYMDGTIYAKTNFTNSGSITVQITQQSEAVVIINNTIAVTQVIQPYSSSQTNNNNNNNMPMLSLAEAVAIIYIGFAIFSYMVLLRVDKKIKGVEKVPESYSTENVPADVQTILKVAGHKIDTPDKKKLVNDLVDFMRSDKHKNEGDKK